MVLCLGDTAFNQLRITGLGVNNLALLGKELITRPYLT